MKFYNCTVGAFYRIIIGNHKGKIQIVYTIFLKFLNDWFSVCFGGIHYVGVIFWFLANTWKKTHHTIKVRLLRYTFGHKVISYTIPTSNASTENVNPIHTNDKSGQVINIVQCKSSNSRCVKTIGQ